MSDTTTPAAQPAAPAPEPAVTPSAGTQAPEGFVSREELDRVEAQRRSFQAENDRLKSQLAAAPAPAAPAATPQPTAQTATDFDPIAFRKSLLSDVVTATRLTTASEKLKAEYPHAAVADPTIFDRAAEFDSVDAFQTFVKSAHDRVAALLNPPAPAATQGDPAATAAVTPPAGNPGSQAGDPTPAQIAAMSIDQMNELEKASPGVIDRVLRSAMK